MRVLTSIAKADGVNSATLCQSRRALGRAVGAGAQVRTATLVTIQSRLGLLHPESVTTAIDAGQLG